MLHFLLDLLYPKYSNDGSEGEWLTTEEQKTLKRTLRPILLDSKTLRRRELRHIDAVVAAGSYGSSPLLRRAILTFKYKRIPALRSMLAELMISAIPGLLLPPPILWDPRDFVPVLCPVPLHWTRRFSRGFNQAELLTKEVGASMHWEVRELLRRTRPTGHQTRRGREERLKALVDAFSWVRNSNTETRNPKTGMSESNSDFGFGISDFVPPAWVILIDDLCTTGATLDECSKALKKAGVKWVSGLVVAYG